MIKYTKHLDPYLAHHKRHHNSAVCGGGESNHRVEDWQERNGIQRLPPSGAGSCGAGDWVSCMKTKEEWCRKLTHPRTFLSVGWG